MDINNLDELKVILEKANLDAYVEAITNFKNALITDENVEINDTRIEAALLRKVCELQQAATLTANSERRSSYKTERKTSSTSEGPAKERYDSPNTQRFFINVGSKEGFDRDTLKDFVIKHCEGVTNEIFSDSFVKETYSFFELPKEFSDKVMAKLNGLKVGEREVNVELSSRKPSGERSSGRRSFAPRRNFGHSEGGYRGNGRSFSHGDRDNRGSKFSKNTGYGRKHY